MEEVGLAIVKTHDLEMLLNTLLPVHSELRTVRRGLLFLTDFAVDTRYRGSNASKRQATAALRWATKVRASARNLLGIRDKS